MPAEFVRPNRPPSKAWRLPDVYKRQNLFRDGGDALAPQLDAFVDAVMNGSMPAEPHSHKGMALVENVRWVAEHAYGVPAERVMLKDGFVESLQAATDLCASAGMNLSLIHI